MKKLIIKLIFISIFFCLFSSCSNNSPWKYIFDFDKHLSENPSTSSYEKKNPNTPENVLFNLARAYESKLLEDYMECFVSPYDNLPNHQFQFESKETKNSLEPGQKWDYELEKQCTTNLFSDKEKNGIKVKSIKLILTPKLQSAEKFQDVYKKYVVKIDVDYQLIIYAEIANSSNSGFSANKTAQFKLVNLGTETNELWKIYYWLDEPY
ncbi:MAG: hypothetical protein ABIB46_02550 [bacterium]